MIFARSFVEFILLIHDFGAVDWAELITLDLSHYEQPGGKQDLVKQLDHAVRNVGMSLSVVLAKDGDLYSSHPRPPTPPDPLNILSFDSICKGKALIETGNRILLREKLQHQPRRH